MGSVELATPTTNEIIEFGSFRHPETVLKEADLVAKTFKKRADELQLYKKIGPSKHLLIEGWQMLAAMYRVSAGVVDDRYIQMGDAHGFEATAEAIFVPTRQQISTAKAMCLSDEENWGMRNKYEWQNNKRVLVGSTPTPLQQIRSMAQTRACSKVLSNLLKWVARMAGFAAAPAEDMSASDAPFETEGQPVNPPQRKPQQPESSDNNGNGGPRVVTEKQASRIWALGHAASKSKDEVLAILKHFGFESAKDVTAEKYEAICSEIQKGDAQ